MKKKKCRLQLCSFNICIAGTIFAYGVTSSGKTHTMHVRIIVYVSSRILYCGARRRPYSSLYTCIHHDHMLLIFMIPFLGLHKFYELIIQSTQ